MQAARDLAQLLQPGVELARGLLEQLGARPPGRTPAAPARRAASARRETRCCCAPSCRLRSSRRRCSSPALTSRAREAIRSARACALATASETSSQNAPSRFSVSGGSGSSLAIATAPQSDAGDDDRRGGGGAVADAEDRVRDLAARRRPSRRCARARRCAAPVRPPSSRRRSRVAEREDVDAVAVVAADDRRRAVALVAHDRGRVDLQHARALLRDRREHPLGAGLRGDERRHPPQRALLVARARRPRPASPPGRPAAPLVRRAGARSVRSMPVVTSGRRAVVARHRPVRPRDQPPAAVLRPPVPDLRARRAGPPDVGEELAERLALLGRDHEVARVAAEHLVAREPGRALARVVEQHDPALRVEDADERLGGLGEDRAKESPSTNSSGRVSCATSKEVTPRAGGYACKPWRAMSDSMLSRSIVSP